MMRVERRQHALDGAALGRVDHREGGVDVEIAGHQHVRLAEEHHHVAVAVRVRHVNELHRLVVEEELVPGSEEGLGRRGVDRQRRLHRRQPVAGVLVGDDLGEVGRGLPRLAGEVAGDDRPAGRGHLGVAARVIGVGMRVDDPPDRLVARQPLDLGNHRLGQRVGHGVHDQHAVAADLHRGVDEAAHHHPDVALDVQRLHGGRRPAARAAASTAASAAASLPRHRHDRARGERRQARDAPPGPDVHPPRARYRPPAFFMNSGRAVSAPPRAASSGILNFFA